MIWIYCSKQGLHITEFKNIGFTHENTASIKERMHFTVFDHIKDGQSVLSSVMIFQEVTKSKVPYIINFWAFFRLISWNNGNNLSLLLKKELLKYFS